MAKRFQTLKDEEIVKVIQGIEQYQCPAGRRPMLRALFLLLGNLGLRVSEATALQWRAVDFDRGEITVHTLKQRRENGLHHEDHEDTLPLDSKTLEALRALHNGAQPADRIFPISRHSTYNIFQRLLHYACLRPIKLHSLRHSAVTRWVRTGNLAFAREMARHASLATTSLYTHCDDLRKQLESVPPVG